MAIRVVVQVDNAGDWIAANANARFRLDRDTTAAFAAPAEVTTTALTSGTERYEVWDSSGATTSWYRFRIEDNADAGLSGWSTPWQVLTDQAIATLASVKQRLGTGATTTDDDTLASIIGAINGSIVQRLGYYPGPSDDTSRVFHGKDAIGRRLWVPGGVRSITTLAIGGSTGASQTNATSTDYVLGPDSYLLRSGEPSHFIEWKDRTTGNWGSWPYGYSNVTITGLFGWGIVPDDLVHVATAWAIRDWKARNTGDAGFVGSEEFGGTDLSRIPFEWRRVIDTYKIRWL